MSYTIIAYINTLILNIMLGVSQGSQPLVSYHYGQRDRKGCRRLLQYGLVTLAGMTVLCFGAVQLFAPQIVHIFLGDNNAALSDVSVGALRRYGLCYLLVGFNVLMGGFLTAVEQPRPAICISTGRGLVLQAGALLALAALWGGEAILVCTGDLRGGVSGHGAGVHGSLLEIQPDAGCGVIQFIK